MNTPTIGWIGLGKMGMPMTQQLLKAGYPLTVYNRTKEKEAAFKAAGIGTAPDPAALVSQTEVVFLMVTDDLAVRELFTSDNGLLSARPGGKVFINMSTVSPDVSKEMAALCRQIGNEYVDAPVSGSVKQATDGQLVIMVGAEEKTFVQIKPILDKIGRLSLRVGPTGSGNVAKLAINTLLAICSQGLSEAILFAKHNGIAVDDFTQLLNNSALGSPYFKIKGDAIVQKNFQPAFALKHIAKDLRLAHDKGLTTPLAVQTYQTFQEAEPTLGQEDIIAVFKALGA